MDLFRKSIFNFSFNYFVARNSSNQTIFCVNLEYMKKAETFIKTFIRIRPSSGNSVFRDPSDHSCLNCCDKLYKFDHVFSPQSTDSELFERIGFDLVQNIINGYNSTLFAYGQTGTGKTYTMTGNAEKEGLVQRSLNLLLKRLENQPNLEYFSLRMNYIEVYNQSIRDLLSDKESKIIIREFSKTGFSLEGLESVEIGNEIAFKKELRRGLLKRSTKATKMNEVSSRSHTILTIIVETKKYDDEKGCLVRSSKLNFVDLAGSQKQKQTQVSGNQLKQASNINKSLTTLSLVISKLSEKNVKQSHIPYRQSVLTKALKDSLGGNSLTTFIGTISAQKLWTSETISTLLFFQRLKKVKNLVSVNEKIEGTEDELIKKISFLQERITQLQQQNHQLVRINKGAQQKIDQLLDHINELQVKIAYQPSSLSIFQTCRGANPPSQLLSSIFTSCGTDLSSTQSLRTIEEVQSSKISLSKNNIDQFKPAEDSKKRLPSYKSCGNNLPKVIPDIQTDDKKRMSNLWQLQNEFLKEQIAKYHEQDQTYAYFIKLISQNIEKFNFQHAKMNLIRSQTQRLKNAELHLIDYRRKFEDLLLLSEKQQALMKSQLCQVRSLELDKISKRSIYISAEARLREQIQGYMQREKKSNQKIKEMEEDFKIHIFKEQEKQLEMRQNEKQLRNDNSMLQQQNIRLKQIVKYLEKVVDEASQISENTSNNQHNQEREIQIKKYEEKIKDLQSIIQNDFIDSIKDLQNHLEQQKNLNEFMVHKNYELLQRLNFQENEIAQYKKKCEQLQQQQADHLQFIVLYEGKPTTISELIEKCTQLSTLKDSLQSEANQLRVTLQKAIQRVNITNAILVNERQTFKQLQTLFRYESKIKNQQLIRAKQDKADFDKNTGIQIQQLQRKITELNNHISKIESQTSNEQYHSNKKYQSKVKQIEERYQDKINQIEAQYAIKERTHQSVRQKLQQQNKSLISQLSLCIKKIAEVNKLYRTEQYAFYKKKLSFDKKIQALSKQIKQQSI